MSLKKMAVVGRTSDELSHTNIEGKPGGLGGAGDISIFVTRIGANIIPSKRENNKTTEEPPAIFLIRKFPK